MSLVFLTQKVALCFGRETSRCQENSTKMYANAITRINREVRKSGICFPLKYSMLPSGNHKSRDSPLGYSSDVTENTDRVVRKHLALLSQTKVANVAIGLHPLSKFETFESTC